MGGWSIAHADGAYKVEHHNTFTSTENSPPATAFNAFTPKPSVRLGGAEYFIPATALPLARTRNVSTIRKKNTLLTSSVIKGLRSRRRGAIRLVVWQPDRTAMSGHPAKNCFACNRLMRNWLSVHTSNLGATCISRAYTATVHWGEMKHVASATPKTANTPSTTGNHHCWVHTAQRHLLRHRLRQQQQHRERLHLFYTSKDIYNYHSFIAASSSATSTTRTTATTSVFFSFIAALSQHHLQPQHLRILLIIRQRRTTIIITSATLDTALSLWYPCRPGDFQAHASHSFTGNSPPLDFQHFARRSTRSI